MELTAVLVTMFPKAAASEGAARRAVLEARQAVLSGGGTTADPLAQTAPAEPRAFALWTTWYSEGLYRAWRATWTLPEPFESAAFDEFAEVRSE